MKTRGVTIFSGQSFLVPQGVQRIDTSSTHGWQVRYQGTRFFSDRSADGSGAPASLQAATKELLRRIATLPAPVRLLRAPSASKSSGLPPGISGPIVRAATDRRVQSASLSVVLPHFGQQPSVRSVFIGTENTYTKARFRQALAKAVALRQEAESRYVAAATRAKRQEARQLKATRRGGSSAA